jgi:hypothetical protein
MSPGAGESQDLISLKQSGSMMAALPIRNEIEQRDKTERKEDKESAVSHHGHPTALAEHWATISQRSDRPARRASGSRLSGREADREICPAAVLLD